MSSNYGIARAWLMASVILFGVLVACRGSSADSPAPNPGVAHAPASASPSDTAQKPASPAASATVSAHGFSGDRAFDQVAKLVGFGPRPPASDAIHKTQEYIIGQLHDFGCKVDTDDFTAPTPIGRLAMKNIVAKIPGTGSNIILMATHYDTDTLDPDDRKMTNFVGADDGGSSTGLMLEMARVLCGKPQAANIWIAFLDGEEAVQHWNIKTDSVYGSRELAAKLAVSGDLARVKAFILADLVGGKRSHMKPEANSTSWLVDIVWATAARLGHQDIFPRDPIGQIEDDHIPFMDRKVPVVDIIDLDTTNDVAYWHTPQDTLDKISAKTLQVVGDVILASLPDIIKHNR